MFSNTLHGESQRLMELLGQRLRAERVQQGISATQFCERIQVSRPTLRDMESGAGGTHFSNWIRAFGALDRSAELEALLAPRENLIERLRQGPHRRIRVRNP